MNKKEWKKEIVSWVKTVVFTFAVYFIVTNTLIANAMVPTGSMENTIMTGDLSLIHISEPTRP